MAKTEIRIYIEERAVELRKDGRVVYRYDNCHSLEHAITLAGRANEEIKRAEVLPKGSVRQE